MKRFSYAVIFLSSVCICVNVIVLSFVFLYSHPVQAAGIDPEAIAQQYYTKCYTGGDGEYCYAAQFAQLARKYDYPQVLSVLSSLENLDPGARGCHLIAHAISNGEVYKAPSKWEEYLAEVDPNMCSGGLIHGILEAHSYIDKGFTLNASSINSICTYLQKVQGPTGRYNCSHILGHLTMVQEKGDINNSAAICDTITSDLQYECYSGVFMENETRTEMVAEDIAKYIPWNEQTTQAQEAICRAQTGVRAAACWREIAHLYVYIGNNDPQVLYKDCQNAPTQEDAMDCYIHGVGVLVATYNTSNTDISQVCTPFNTNSAQALNCYSFSISALLSSTPDFTDRAVTICKAAPSAFQSECYQQIGTHLSQVVSDKTSKAKYCGIISDKTFQADCMNTS